LRHSCRCNWLLILVFSFFCCFAFLLFVICYLLFAVCFLRFAFACSLPQTQSAHRAMARMVLTGRRVRGTPSTGGPALRGLAGSRRVSAGSSGPVLPSTVTHQVSSHPSTKPTWAMRRRLV